MDSATLKHPQRLQHPRIRRTMGSATLKHPQRLQHPRIRRTMGSATSQMHRHGPSVRRARTTTASVDLQMRTLPLHLP